MPSLITMSPVNNTPSVQENNLKDKTAAGTTPNTSSQDSGLYIKETDSSQERQLQSQQDFTNRPESITLSNVFRILGRAEEFQVLSSGVTAYLVHSNGRIISLSAGIDRQYLQFDNSRSNINSVLNNTIGEFLEQKSQEATEANASLKESDTDSKHKIMESQTNQEEAFVRYTRRGEKEESKNGNSSLADHYEDDESENKDDTSSQYQPSNRISNAIIINKANYSATGDSDGLKQENTNIISEQA